MNPNQQYRITFNQKDNKRWGLTDIPEGMDFATMREGFTKRVTYFWRDPHILDEKTNLLWGHGINIFNEKDATCISFRAFREDPNSTLSNSIHSGIYQLCDTKLVRTGPLNPLGLATIIKTRAELTKLGIVPHDYQ